MARKPNFRFERQERERIHAEKRAARDALKEQRKAESAAEAVEAPATDSAPAAAAPAPAASRQPAASSEAQKETVAAAMKALETMTPAEIATLHQNAVRLASAGSPKQRAAAQELLPRLEAELQRLEEAKRQAAAARLAGAAKRSKKE